MPQGMIWQILVGSFGIAAAFLLVGGWVILRYQRDRQHFHLMQAALERGITALPGLVPSWVVSLRQGVLALALGIGVAIAGYLVLSDSYRIAEAPTDAVTTRMATEDMRRPFPPPPPPPDWMGRTDGRDGPPPGPGGRPDGPPGPRGSAGGPPPQRISPAMERWHRMQTERLTGLISMSAGGILALLGLVRIGFASLERKFAIAAVDSDNPTA